MSIIDLTNMAMEDTFEATILPKGEEAKLRLINIVTGTDKNNEAYMMPFFESVDDPYCKEFGDYLPLPNSDMSPKKLNDSKNRINSFLAAFDIDGSKEIVIEEVRGNEGWAILGIGTDQSDQPVNKISRYSSGQ
ncbi:MAG: hypothetical protein DRH37_01215 [Deltaproteobacteria bacterium]|nr:MAG: hypothetical protein DRH37_01215 [Deltaproteobacteria bacterium]